VVQADVIAFLRAPRRGPPWTWVFVDPPYATTLAADALALLGAAPDRLAPGATAVIEHDRRHLPPDTAGNLVRTDQRRYGDTLISFYRPAP
jgi:16S rRNA G966 N2-methylase RsmD